MAPRAKLLVYQILPNSEVAADYLPFNVEGDYPQQVQAAFSQDEAKPGDRSEVVACRPRARPGSGWRRSTGRSSSWPRTG